jgi:hypothetical protein
VLLAFLAAGVAEALSLTAILPLLSIAIGDPVDSNIGKFIVQLLDRVDIDPTIGAMLLIILCGIIFKSLVLLVANRQIGYTVANIATKLRLELIEALFASRWRYRSISCSDRLFTRCCCAFFIHTGICIYSYCLACIMAGGLNIPNYRRYLSVIDVSPSSRCT